MAINKVAIQPLILPVEYDMVTVPEFQGGIIPVAEPIPATEVLEELHKPPGVASLNVTVLPWQNDEGPVIAAGAGFTVSGNVELHPVTNV